MEIVDYILRALFSFIDRLIAWGIEKTYIVICDISTLMINSGVIKEFSNRINVFLGLFMLFWLAVRTISYVVEPDKFSDNSQGFSKVVRNTVVMLVMLVLVNYVFTFAYRIQNELLGITSGKNTMLKLVFGTNYVSSSSSNKEIAYKLPLYLYSSFLEPSSRIKDKCSSDKMLGKDAQVKKDCVTMLSDLDPDGNLASYYSMAYGSNGGVNSLLDLEVVTKKKSGKFIFTYRYLISTICGGMMLIMMVSTAIDIAIRIFKFAFLQLIAPIPIISYIDPKSGEDGMFKKWLQNCLSTYASIFIRLFSVYFAVYMIVLVATSDTSIKTISGETYEFTNPFVTVMLILGALQFAKQFPKLINEIFGIELGGGTFGSMVKATGKGLKKGGKAALGVTKTGAKALGAGALGAVGGAASAAWAAGRKKQGLGRGAWNTTKGFFGGAGRAMGNSIKSGKVLGAAGAGISQTQDARNKSDVYHENGLSLGSRIGDSIDRATGTVNSHGGYGQIENRARSLQNEIDDLDMKENALRMTAAQIAGNSGYSGDELLSYNQKYGDYVSARKQLEDYYSSGQAGNISPEKINDALSKWDSKYQSQHQDVDLKGFSKEKYESSERYASIAKQIEKVNEESHNKRDEIKKVNNIINARNGKKK